MKLRQLLKLLYPHCWYTINCVDDGKTVTHYGLRDDHLKYLDYNVLYVDDGDQEIRIAISLKYDDPAEYYTEPCFGDGTSLFTESKLKDWWDSIGVN